MFENFTEVQKILAAVGATTIGACWVVWMLNKYGFLSFKRSDKLNTDSMTGTGDRRCDPNYVEKSEFNLAQTKQVEQFAIVNDRIDKIADKQEKRDNKLWNGINAIRKELSDQIGTLNTTIINHFDK